MCNSTKKVIHALQYQEGVRAMCVAEKGGYVYSHPYDLGAYENLTSVGHYSSCFLSSSVSSPFFHDNLQFFFFYKKSLVFFFYCMELSCFTTEYPLRCMCFIALDTYLYQCLNWFPLAMQVLGPNVLCWPFPSTKHIDSGLRFRTAFDSVPRTPVSK